MCARKRTNIEYIIEMAKSFINHEMKDFVFYMDFSYEINNRYQKMVKEDPMMADFIYVYLVEKGIHRYDNVDAQTFYKIIKENLKEVIDGFEGRFDIW